MDSELGYSASSEPVVEVVSKMVKDIFSELQITLNRLVSITHQPQNSPDLFSLLTKDMNSDLRRLESTLKQRWEELEAICGRLDRDWDLKG
jgi:hypothetical protein